MKNEAYVVTEIVVRKMASGCFSLSACNKYGGVVWGNYYETIEECEKIAKEMNIPITVEVSE